MLSMIPCACAYCPVKKLARDGEQRGVVMKALRNSAPSLPIRSRLGVLMNGWPTTPNSSQRRSSIRMNTMLGFASRAAPGPSVLNHDEALLLIADNDKAGTRKRRNTE